MFSHLDSACPQNASPRMHENCVTWLYTGFLPETKPSDEEHNTRARRFEERNTVRDLPYVRGFHSDVFRISAGNWVPNNPLSHPVALHLLAYGCHSAGKLQAWDHRQPCGPITVRPTFTL